MGFMNYQNYQAKIEYDSDLETFMGIVINLESPVTFYGKSVDELKREFAKSIAEYHKTCGEHGFLSHSFPFEDSGKTMASSMKLAKDLLNGIPVIFLENDFSR